MHRSKPGARENIGAGIGPVATVIAAFGYVLAK